MRWLYSFGIPIYYALVYVAAFFKPKAALWITGRKRVFQQLKSLDHRYPVIWMHCASLGEFEQGRPILEAIKQHNPQIQILLTFYSPSGYEIRKNYELADCITYLPLDTARNANRFLQVAQPDCAIFVKYEFWFHHLQALHQSNIPTYLISAIFRPKQWFFRKQGGFFRQMLFYFDHIFVQNESSLKLLHSIDYQKVSVAGDTRVDRVLKISETAKRFPIIEDFLTDLPTLIIGSSWQPDEALLANYIRTHADKWQFIFAPHDIAETHIQNLVARFNLPTQRYTTYQKGNAAKVLIIDNIGLLSQLYQYGTVAYVGGGFGTGIHNTLEPIAFELPVLFGPRYQKFEEAVQLVKMGGAFVVHRQADLDQQLEKLRQPLHRQEAIRAIQSFLEKNRGATPKIVQYLENQFDFF